MVRIGIIREGKVPPDSRVAVSPEGCRQLLNKFPSLEIQVQSSPSRCFSDNEFAEQGISVVSHVSGCAVLLGVKEIPVEHGYPVTDRVAVSLGKA